MFRVYGVVYRGSYRVFFFGFFFGFLRVVLGFVGFSRFLGFCLKVFFSFGGVRVVGCRGLGVWGCRVSGFSGFRAFGF